MNETKYIALFKGIKMLQRERFWAIVVMIALGEVGYLTIRLIEATR